MEERDAEAPVCQLLRLLSFACYDAVGRFCVFRQSACQMKLLRVLCVCLRGLARGV